VDGLSYEMKLHVKLGLELYKLTNLRSWIMDFDN
jgi:hypothetical protein